MNAPAVKWIFMTCYWCKLQRNQKKNSSKTRGSNNLLWELSSFKDILLSYQSTTAMTEDISKDKTNFRESPSVLKSSVSGKMMFLMCSFQPNIMIYSIKEVGTVRSNIISSTDGFWLAVGVQISLKLVPTISFSTVVVYVVVVDPLETFKTIYL